MFKKYFLVSSLVPTRLSQKVQAGPFVNFFLPKVYQVHHVLEQYGWSKKLFFAKVMSSLMLA